MSSRFYIFIFLFCIICFSSVRVKNAFFYLEQGNQEFNNQKISNAIFFYQKSLQKNPRFVPALLKLSQIYRSWSLYPISLEYLERALLLESNNYDVIIEHLYILLDLEKKEKFNKLLQKALTMFPYNAELGSLKALFHMKYGNFIFAKTILLKNLKEFPEHILSLVSLGEVYIQLGELSLAEKKFHEVIQRESKTNIYILYRIAQAYSQISDISKPSQFEYIKKRLEKSIAILKNILKYDSKYPQANFLLARLYTFLGNSMDKTYLEQVDKQIMKNILLETYEASLFPEKRKNIYNRLKLQDTGNSIFQALNEYNTLSQVSPDGLELISIGKNHYKMADQFFQEGNYQQSLWYAHYSLFFHPKNILTHKLILKIYSILGYKTLSIQEAKKIKTLTKVRRDQYLYEKLVRSYKPSGFIQKINTEILTNVMKKSSKPIQFIFLNFLPDNILESTPCLDELLLFLFHVTIKDEYLYTILNEEIHGSIQRKIQSKYPFQKKYYFLPQIQNDIASILQIEYPDLDISNIFIVFGNYDEALDGSAILLRTKILNLGSGFEYPEIQVQEFGDNYIYNSVFQVFTSIKHLISVNATILLKEKEYIFVDIGTIHEVSKDTRMFFPYKNSKIYFKLEESDELFSKWKIESPEKMLFVKKDKKVIIEK